MYSCRLNQIRGENNLEIDNKQILSSCWTFEKKKRKKTNKQIFRNELFLSHLLLYVIPSISKKNQSAALTFHFFDWQNVTSRPIG